MKDIKELFNERNVALEEKEAIINEFTANILDSMPHVCQGCEIFIKQKAEGSDPDVVWSNVFYLDDDDVVVLLGVLQYKDGDTVILNSGESVTFNETTAPLFKAMLHIGIPYNIAIDGSVDDVVTFLGETMDITENDDDDAMPPHIMLGGDDAMPTFNIEELTDDQKQAMEMFLASENIKGSNN